MADLIDLAARRPRSPAEETAEQALDAVLRLIRESSDRTGAALALIAGFARFLATRGVTAEEIARLVERHIAQELGPRPVGPASR